MMHFVCENRKIQRKIRGKSAVGESFLSRLASGMTQTDDWLVAMFGSDSL